MTNRVTELKLNQMKKIKLNAGKSEYFKLLVEKSAVKIFERRQSAGKTRIVKTLK